MGVGSSIDDTFQKFIDLRLCPYAICAGCEGVSAIFSIVNHIVTFTYLLFFLTPS